MRPTSERALVAVQVKGHSLAQDLHMKGGVPSKDVIPFLQSLADQGDTRKAGILGRVFTDGSDGIAQDEAEAFKYTLNAAVGGVFAARLATLTARQSHYLSACRCCPRKPSSLQHTNASVNAELSGIGSLEGPATSSPCEAQALRCRG
jgi:hypothetical protein